MNTRYRHVTSPIGPMIMAAQGAGITGLWFDGQKHFSGVGAQWQLANDDPVLDQACAQLDRFFDGDLRAFSVSLALAGTPFQQKVWQALCGIRFAERMTYGEVAAQLGSPRAVRAVAAAIGRNPVSIIVPCHRVMGADGSLTGYAGGLNRKRALLDLEASHAGSAHDATNNRDQGARDGPLFAPTCPS